MAAYHALGFFNIGGYEWLIILIIALLLFGRRLPEVMRGLGGGVREFRKGIDGAADDAPKANEPKQDMLAEDKKVEPSKATETEDSKQS